jgi:hypothetical protein
MNTTIVACVCGVAFLATFFSCYFFFFKEVSESVIGRIVACVLMSIVVAIIVMFITIPVLMGMGK